MTYQKQLIKLLPFIAVSSSLYGVNAAASSFDTSLLVGNARDADISKILTDEELSSGEYVMNVYVNDEWKGYYSVYATDGPTKNIYISYEDAKKLNIDMRGLTKTPDDRVSLSELAYGGKVSTDLNALKITLATPQKYILTTERGYVNPELWSSGVPGINFGYNLAYYSARNPRYTNYDNDEVRGNTTTNNAYGSLNTTISLARFGQIKDSSYFTRTDSIYDDKKFTYRNNYRYYQYHIKPLFSNLRLGTFNTEGFVFDSRRVKGFSLASDDAMKPDSQRDYAPIVRGVARSNALVQVFQGGQMVYQENVPPGAFEFRNLQATNLGGDLLVVVKESDGTQLTFTVPYAAVSGMLKEGNYQYSVVAGKLHEETLKNGPRFVSAEMRYGLNNTFTVYGGTILNSDYKSFAIGTGINTSYGAFSVDITQSNAHFNNRSESGQSIRFLYSKLFDTTHTNVTIAGYRYATKNFLTLNDYAYLSRPGYQIIDTDVDPLDIFKIDSILGNRPKNTVTATINQNLGEGWGSFSFSGIYRDYWNKNSSSKEFTLGYSNSYKSINYTLMATRSYRSRYFDSAQKSKATNNYYASISFPFSLFDKQVYASTSASVDDSGYNNGSVSLSGTALAFDRLSYSVSANNQKGGDNSYAANANYRSSIATIGGSISTSKNYKQYGFNASGTVAVIPWNILMANGSSDTLIVAKAAGAGNYLVNGDNSNTTNSSGLALVPYAQPYRNNIIRVEQDNDSYGAKPFNTMASVAPVEGSINIIEFKTDSRKDWYIDAIDEWGKPLPFGSSLLDEKETNIGYVGQSSTLYVHAAKFPNQIQVQLKNSSCVIENPSNVVNHKNVCKVKR